MRECEAVALAGGVKDAVGETAHERSLLLTPPARADRLGERPDLRRHSGPVGAAALHQPAHAARAYAHRRGRLRSRKPLQIAERGGLQLALAETQAQRLKELAQPVAIIEGRGEVAAAVLPAGARTGARYRGIRAGHVDREQQVAAARSAMLLNCATERHERQPTGEIGDLRSL